MEALFLSIVNMSITACYVILAVLLVRLLLKRAPRIFSYALWAIVLFRLVCPFSFKSVVSLVPSTETVSAKVLSGSLPAINSGIPLVDKAVNPVLQHSATVASATTAQPTLSFMSVASVVWLAGMAVLLLYGVFSFLRFRNRLVYATRSFEGMWETDALSTPFVLGLFRPRIYIPVGLNEEEKEYMLAHEKTHIRHKDYIIRPIAYIVLAIHWFNPLVWLSYFLMERDMEMSCDESVIKRSGTDIRGAYCRSLLSLSAKRSGLLLPPAFGESNTKGRIKNILRYKKPALVVVALAILLSVSLLTAFVTNPVNGKNDNNNVVVSRTEKPAGISPSPVSAVSPAQTGDAKTAAPSAGLASLQAKRYSKMIEEFGQVPAIETFKDSYKGLNLDGDKLPDKAEIEGEEGSRSIKVEFGNGDSSLVKSGEPEYPEYIGHYFQIKGVDLDDDSVNEIVLVVDLGGNGGDGSCWMCVYKKENGKYHKISSPLEGLPYKLTWDKSLVTVTCKDTGYRETVADAEMVKQHYTKQEVPDEWETLRKTSVTGNDAIECDGISDFIFEKDNGSGKTYMKIKQYMTGPSAVHVDKFGYCITTLGWSTDGSYKVEDAYFVMADE